MEPLSALSVAASVVQFLDFGTNLLKGTWRVYSTSQTASPWKEISSDLPKRKRLSNQAVEVSLAYLVSIVS